jgi:hypothetical protein
MGGNAMNNDTIIEAIRALMANDSALINKLAAGAVPPCFTPDAAAMIALAQLCKDALDTIALMQASSTPNAIAADDKRIYTLIVSEADRLLYMRALDAYASMALKRGNHNDSNEASTHYMMLNDVADDCESMHDFTA